MDTENRKAKIKTYMMQLQNGNIRGNQMECLDYIYKNQGATVHEMRTALAMAHQSLTPSISLLLDCGLIREIGQVKIKDSFYSQYEFEPDAGNQDILAKERLDEKFKQWMERGKDFMELMHSRLIYELGYKDTWNGL